jgi:hypothetical protein
MRALIAFGIAAAGITLVAYGYHRVSVFFEWPPKSFDEMPITPAPDYSSPSAWLAWPDREGLQDQTPRGLDSRHGGKGVDVFFVRPTTYMRSKVWNAPFDAKGEFDDGVLLYQASVFNACCRIYAPRYRQATNRAQQTGNVKAVDLAYSDVAAAFDYYIKHENMGRPFILASHSQGTTHALRLLQAQIAHTPLQSRMVAAYLIGSFIPLEVGAAGVPVCQTSISTGCLLTWNAAKPGSKGIFGALASGLYWFDGSYHVIGEQQSLCVNPLSWTEGGAGPASANLGALPFSRSRAQLPALVPGAADAKCSNGVLEVTVQPGKKNGLRALLGWYHLLDYNLFYGNIRQNLAERIGAYQAR